MIGMRFKEKATDHRDAVAFLVVVVVGLLILIGLFVSGVIDQLLFLIGFLGLLILIYSRSPRFVIELREYERAVIFRLGKLKGVYGPGWVTVIPFIDEPVIVDIRVQTIDVPKQDVITKNGIKLKIDAIIYLRVKDPVKAVITVKDYKTAAVSYVVAHVRDVVGKMTMEEVVSNIDEVNSELRKGLREVAKEWGIEVEKVEIKEVEFPKEVQEAMHRKRSAEELKLAAKEEAEANAIRIDAIRRAAGNLTGPAIEYLYLEALKKMAEGRSSKIIFPIELTKLAERISGVTGKKYEDVERELKEEFKRFQMQAEMEAQSSEKKKEKKEGSEKKEELSEFGASKKHVKHFIKKKTSKRIPSKKKKKK